MRTRKMENILKSKATKKTHATLCPKKKFPMYMDHIHSLSYKEDWMEGH